MSFLLRCVAGFGCLVSMSLVSSRAHALIPDSGMDAGVCEAGSGLSCEQCDTSGYTPVEMQKPIGPMAAMCTDADISAFDTACGITSGSSSACGTWETTANKTCVDCIFTLQSATSWGPLACPTTGACSYNSGGCIDLALGQVSQEISSGGSGSCGDLITASFGCEDYACGTCSTMDFTTCATSAETNECETYTAAQTSGTGACAALDGGATQAACFPEDDTGIIAMVTFMCGGLIASPDAGTTDAGQPTADAGKPDSGAPKDAGTDTGTTFDSGNGSDGGSDFNQNGGCHCDAAGATSGASTLAIGSLGALALAFTARRRRKR